VYPILCFDALFFKARREGPVMTKAIYTGAENITLEGEKEWRSDAGGGLQAQYLFDR
jgi:transposase-like protein